MTRPDRSRKHLSCILANEQLSQLPEADCESPKSVLRRQLRTEACGHPCINAEQSNTEDFQIRRGSDEFHPRMAMRALGAGRVSYARHEVSLHLTQYGGVFASRILWDF